MHNIETPVLVLLKPISVTGKRKLAIDNVQLAIFGSLLSPRLPVANWPLSIVSSLTYALASAVPVSEVEASVVSIGVQPIGCENAGRDLWYNSPQTGISVARVPRATA